MSIHDMESAAEEWRKLQVTALCDTVAKQHASALIHEEIAALRNSISTIKKEVYTWKAKHNRLCDIHRLPEGVLVRIFYLLAHDIGNPPVAHHMFITHVCTHWRSLALKHTGLWIRPNFHRPLIAQQMAKWAQPDPLTIDFHIVNVSQRDLVDYYIPRLHSLRQNIGRSRDLILQLDPLPHLVQETGADWVRSCLQEPAPTLETLRVTCVGCVQTLPEVLFSGVCPQLRGVSLHNWLFKLPRNDTSLLHFPAHLTTLVLTRDSNRYNLRESSMAASSFVRLLQHGPQLQILRLRDCLCLPSESAQETEPMAQMARLAHLKEIQITEKAEVVECFFRMVEYSSLALVEVTFSYSHTINASVDAIVRDVTGRLAVPIKFLVVSSDYSLACYKGLEQKEDVFGELLCSFRNHSSYPTITGDFFSNPALAHLRGFTYSSPISSLGLWKEVGQLRHLRYLSVIHNHQDFLEVLSQSVESESATLETGASTPLFPSLSCLQLKRWQFETWSPTGHAGWARSISLYMTPPHASVSFGSFKQALLTRQQSGLYMSSIHVSDSLLTPEHAEELKAVTGEKTSWHIFP